MLSPQVGVSHVAGHLLFEAYASAWFFTDNTEFLVTRTQSQAPLWAFQIHVGYLFKRGIWLAASTRQSWGGALSVDGGEKLSAEANNRVGLTVGVPVGSRYALRAAASTALTTSSGNDYNNSFHRVAGCVLNPVTRGGVPVP
jgi:hypothetical protein